jgi:hypothetical protein
MTATARARRLATAELMHDHVNILSAALVTTEAPNEPPHREGLAKPFCQFARTQDRCVLALEADCPDVEAGADFKSASVAAGPSGDFM